MEHSKDEEGDSASLEAEVGDEFFDEVRLPVARLASEELRGSKGEGEVKSINSGSKDSSGTREGCKLRDVIATSVGYSDS